MSLEIKFIKFEVENERAIFIRKCLQYQADIEILFESKFFEFKSGEWKGRRDKNGVLQETDLSCGTWKRKKFSTDKLLT